MNLQICSNLAFIGRSEYEYKFQYNTNILNKFELVKLCVLFSVYSLVKKIDANYIEKFNSEIINYGIKFNKNNHKNINKNIDEFLNSHHCDENFKKYIDFFFVQKLIKNIKINCNRCESEICKCNSESENDCDGEYNGDNKCVFDLTNTITEYEVKKNNNNQNISIFTIFNNLFAIKMKNLDIINNDITKYKPMTTLATFHTAYMDIYEKKYGCGSSCGQNDFKFIDFC